MSTTQNTYRPRRRVQKQRQPSCAYCKEEGHWMKHRSGEAICPKLKAKNGHRHQVNHRQAEQRRTALQSGEWVSSQGSRQASQPRKRQEFRPAANRFEIPSDTESEGEDDQVPITQPKAVATGAWASGASQAVKTSGSVKPSQGLVQKRSDEKLNAIQTEIDELKKELKSEIEKSDGSWGDACDIDDLEEQIADLEGQLTIFLA
jgi:hypothetical protein